MRRVLGFAGLIVACVGACVPMFVPPPGSTVWDRSLRSVAARELGCPQVTWAGGELFEPTDRELQQKTYEFQAMGCGLETRYRVVVRPQAEDAIDRIAGVRPARPSDAVTGALSGEAPQMPTDEGGEYGGGYGGGGGGGGTYVHGYTRRDGTTVRGYYRSGGGSGHRGGGGRR
jgi:hypothetical protein